MKFILIFLIFFANLELFGEWAPYGTKTSGVDTFARQHPIYEAIEAGDLQRVKDQLAGGASLEQPYVNPIQGSSIPYKYTPLYFVCSIQHDDKTDQYLNIAKFLLERGANPNADWHEMQDPTNPLYVTVSKYTYEISRDKKNKNFIEYYKKLIHLLIEKGADVNKEGGILGSPLAELEHAYSDMTVGIHIDAADKEAVDSLKELINYFVKHGSKTSENHTDKLLDFLKSDNEQLNALGKEMISAGAKVDDRIFYDLLDNNEGGKHDETLEFLIDHGFDINKPDSEGNKLISRVSSPDAIKFLLAHGAKQEDIPDYRQESLMDEGELLSDKATIGETIEFYLNPVWNFILWLWDSMSWWMIVGLIAAWYYKDFLIKKLKQILNAKRDKANEEAKVLLKGKIRRINEKLNRIETDYLPDEAKEVAKLRDEVNELTKILDQKADKYDFSGIKKNLENLEKASQEIVKKVDGLNAEMSKVKEVYDRVKSDYETISMISVRISEEIRSYEGFEGVESFQGRVREHGDRRSQAKELIEKVKMFEDMKRFAEQDAQYIEVIIRDIKALEGEWENFKAGMKEYQPLMSQAKKMGEKASRLRTECSSVGGDEVAIALERTFAGIVDDLQMMAQEMRSTSTRKEALYYADRIRLLDQKLNETEREFNEKFKSVIEFKRLPNDMAKKEWILKNGNISWFFNDARIAEKLKVFDPMESHFRYLLNANEKIKFLDLKAERDGEGKITGKILMMELSSGMSYEEFKNVWVAWRRDKAVDTRIKNWKEKNNKDKEDAEHKREYDVVTEFTGMTYD